MDWVFEDQLASWHTALEPDGDFLASTFHLDQTGKAHQEQSGGRVRAHPL